MLEEQENFKWKPKYTIHTLIDEMIESWTKTLKIMFFNLFHCNNLYLFLLNFISRKIANNHILQFKN